MNIVKAIPTFAYLLALYNILAFSSALDHALFNLELISGARVTVDVHHLMIFVGVLALYIEIFKSTLSSIMSIIDHALSLIVFIVFLIELLVVKAVGTSSFMILTFMSMFDVVGGFTVTISASRRDIAIGG